MDISNTIFNNSSYNSPKSESALSLLSQERHERSPSLGSNKGVTPSPAVLKPTPTPSPVVKPTPAPTTATTPNSINNKINNLSNSSSSSPVLNNRANPTPPNNNSTGTNFMSELKTRQTSVRKPAPPNDNIDTTPVKPVILKPVPIKPVMPNIQTQKSTPLPTKPKIPGLTKKPDQFCLVNPTSLKPSCEDKPSNNGEDFSFQTLIARAKEGQTKDKPVPPPKPKINLNS